MANEKILNTRIKLKYDSFANWQNENPTLLEGEIAIAYLGETHTQVSSGANNHPVLFKVGAYKLDASGKKTTTLAKFNELPWASALAADVYSWAKAESVEFDSKDERLVFKTGNTEISSVDLSHFASDTDLAALQEEVSTIDTNTTYSFTTDDNGDLIIKSKEKGGAEVDVITVPILTSAELTAVLNDYVTNGSLATTLAGYVTNGTLDAYKEDVSGEFAKYTKTDDMNVEFAKYVLISELDAKVDGHGYLKAEDITGKADKTQLDNYYTKTEIGAIPQNSTVISLIEANAANFDNYDTSGEVDTKISTALESYYDKDEVDGLIGDLATAMNFVGVDTTLPDSAKDGDVFVLQTKDAEGKVISTAEYVWYQNDWQLLGDESLMGQISSRVDDAEGAIADIQGVIGDYSGTLAAMDAAIQANAKAIADNETDIEGKFSTLNGTVEGHTTTLGQHLEAINKNKDDIAALPASITISSAVVDGEYVSAISGNAKDGFTVSKASLPAVAADVSKVAATAGEHEMVVLTAVADNGTAGHTVKLQATEGVAVTKAGATAIAEGKATDAINALKANLVNNDAAVAGEFVTAAVQSNGLVTVSRRAVKIDELAQDTDTYVIFDCGSASKFI